MQKKSARPCSSRKPGAVPIGFGSTSAPSGNHACCALFSVISRPTLRKKARIVSSTAGSSRCARPKACASTAEVRSSRVGPRPPETSTMSLRSRRAPEGVDHVGGIVAHRGVVSASRCRARAAAPRGTTCCESTISPRSSSSPIVRISAFIASTASRDQRPAAGAAKPPATTSSSITPIPPAKRRSAQRTGPGFQTSNSRNATNPVTSQSGERRRAGSRQQRREREQLPHHLVDHDPAVVLAAEDALRLLRRPDPGGEQPRQRGGVAGRSGCAERQVEGDPDRRAPGARGDRPVARSRARGEEDRGPGQAGRPDVGPGIRWRFSRTAAFAAPLGPRRRLPQPFGAAAGAAERQPGDYSPGAPGVNEIEAKKTRKSGPKLLDSRAFGTGGLGRVREG